MPLSLTALGRMVGIAPSLNATATPTAQVVANGTPPRVRYVHESRMMAPD